MEKVDQRTLDDMVEIASSHADLKEYDKAEQLYREILNRRLENEGIPATYRDMYNLAAVLVSNQKYEEALPLLRDLFVYLSQRTIGRDRPEFMEQEVSDSFKPYYIERATHPSFMDETFARRGVLKSCSKFTWIGAVQADYSLIKCADNQAP